MLAGCGGGGDDDVPVDPDAGATGNVTVTTYGHLLDPAGLKSGVDVIAIDPDGTSRTAVTDADGAATLDVVAGGSVAALYPDQFNGEYSVEVRLEVEPGDELVFGDDRAFDRGAELGTMTVQVPTVSGAQSYWVQGSCGLSNSSVQPTVTITAYANCDVTQDLYVSASNVNAEVLGYAVLPEVTFTRGATLTVDAWEPPTTLALGVSGLSDEVLNLDFFAAAAGGELAGEFNVIPSGGSASASLAWTPAGHDAYVFIEMRSFEGEMRIKDAIDVDATSHTFAPPTLPWVTDVAADLAAPSIEVTADGEYAFDAALLTLSFGSDGQFVRWYVVAPPVGDGATTIALPSLPAPFDGISPTADDQFGQVDATLLDSGAAADYAAVRQRPNAASWDHDARWVHAYHFAQ